MAGNKYTLEDAKTFLASQKEPAKEAAPGKKLEATISFTDRQEQNAARQSKEIFPQPEDNPIMSIAKTGMFPVRQVAKGAFGAAEDIENLLLEAAQMGNQNKASVGDLVRKVSGNDAALTGNELQRTQAYTTELQRNPNLANVGNVGHFMGGMGVPLGSAQGYLAKIPLEITEALNGVPALARIGKAAQQVPIVQDAAQTLAKLRSGASLTTLQSLMKNPLIGGAAAGAGYGSAFGAGEQFGENRQLPTPEQAAGNAMAGAGLGAGFGALQKMLANVKLEQIIKSLSGQSQLAAIPEAGGELSSSLGMSPEKLYQLYKAAILKLQASGLGEKEIMSKHSNLLNSADKTVKALRQGSIETEKGVKYKLGPDGNPLLDAHNNPIPESAGKSPLTVQSDHANADLYSEKVAKLRAEASKIQLDSAKASEKRSYSEGQTQDRRAYSQAQTQEKRTYSENSAQNKIMQNLETHRQKADERQAQRESNIAEKERKTNEQTDTEDEIYRTIFGEIDNARDVEHLKALEREIHASGAGPEGKALLRGHQRSDLMRKLYKRQTELKRRSESTGGSRGFAAFRDSELGESRVSGASTPEPGRVPQNSAESTPPASSSSSPAERLPAEPIEQGKTASKAKEAKAPPVVPSKPNSANGTPKSAEMDVKTFLLGAFRKTLNVAEHGNRENRYKLAVSVDSLADEAGLGLHETTALKRWVSDLAETRRELTYKDLQIERLVKWADEHEAEWVGNQDKVKHELKEDDKGNAYRVLEKIAEQGRYRRMALTYKMRAEYEKATGHNVEFETTAKPGGGEEMRSQTKPQIECVTCGTAEDADWETNMHGGLTINGGIKAMQLPEFKPPKSADELFERMKRLMHMRNHFQQKLRDIKAAKVSTIQNPQGESVDHENFEYLGKDQHGEPITIANVMHKAFEALKLGYIEGKAPDTRVWHVDNSGHVSTVAFKQPRSSGDLHAKLDAAEKLIATVTDPKTGKIDYDAVWASDNFVNKLLAYFPGLSEVAILAHIFRRQLHTFGRNFARASGADTVFAGTVDDILRDHTRFGGDLISEAFHNMLGEINHNFLKDSTGEWHKIESPEALSELLNDYKGVPIFKSEYRNRALQLAKEKSATEGVAFTQEDKSNAIKRADTALMIRAKGKTLADRVQKKMDEMKIRKTDAQTGLVSKEAKAGKIYLPLDLDHKGRVLKSAYNPTFDHALKELHNGLTLQSSQNGNPFYGFAADTASRVSMSIMRNNPGTAIKNFFDQAPMTLAYFHKHFFRAVKDLHSVPGLKDAIERLPVIPAADMSNVQLQERLRDRRAPENAAEKLFGFVDWINGHLQSKAFDPIFGGKSPLVSTADRNFAKYTALASIYKSAEKRGLDRHQFVSDLVSNKLRPEVAKAVMSEMSLALSQTLNSVRPDLNKDLFASSVPGRLLSQYSTPGRRAMKLWTGWVKDSYKGDPNAGLKLAASFAGMVAFGGRGAVPASLSSIYLTAAGAVGHQEDAERSLQSLDQFNLLDRVGIDWSGNFGPDFITQARPTLEAVEEFGHKLVSEAAKAKETGEYIGAISTAALDGFATLPSIGPFGYQVWRKLQKRLRAAGQGSYKQYFEYNGLQHVPIADYSYSDAIRDWVFGGYNPKVSERIRDQKLNLARKADARFRANKDIMPERENEPVASKDLPFLGQPKEKI